MQSRLDSVFIWCFSCPAHCIYSNDMKAKEPSRKLSDAQKIVKILSDNMRAHSNGIRQSKYTTTDELRRLTGMTGAMLRRRIHYARTCAVGVGIIGTTNGYIISTDIKELVVYEQRLRRQIAKLVEVAEHVAQWRRAIHSGQYSIPLPIEIKPTPNAPTSIESTGEIL